MKLWVFVPFGDLRKVSTGIGSLLTLNVLFGNFAVDVVMEVIKDMPAWPGRHLLEGGENRRYFGLRTAMRGVVEFECKNQREHDVWTRGVLRLLCVAAEKNNRYRI